MESELEEAEMKVLRLRFFPGGTKMESIRSENMRGTACGGCSGGRSEELQYVDPVREGMKKKTGTLKFRKKLKC